MAELTQNQRRRKADNFRIWRAATALGWGCTKEEIADKLGLSIGTVSRHFRQSGWKERLGQKRVGAIAGELT